MKYQIVSERTASTVRVTKPDDILPILRKFSSKRQEHFLVLTISSSLEVIRLHIVSIGILNRTLIHPREVFVRAIKDNSASIILAHNHPSGSVEPSREDREATTRLVQAGKLLGIEVLDHIIVGRAGHYSFKGEGEIL